MTEVAAARARFIAYVALSAAARVSGAAVAARLAESFPDWARTARAFQAPPDTASGRAGFLLDFGAPKLIVSFIDAPLPADVFQGDAHQALWSEWQAAARSQRAHVIVTNLSTASDAQGKADESALVFATAATLSAMLPTTVGVSWAMAALFIAPSAFQQAAAAMRRDQLPVQYIIKPRWYADPPQNRSSLGMLTLGLLPFVGREIDHPPSGEQPGAIYARCMNLALYLIRSGPVINDGDTIGQTPTQRISVRFGAYGSTPTYRLDVSAIR